MYVIVTNNNYKDKEKGRRRRIHNTLSAISIQL